LNTAAGRAPSPNFLQKEKKIYLDRNFNLVAIKYMKNYVIFLLDLKVFKG